MTFPSHIWKNKPVMFQSPPTSYKTIINHDYPLLTTINMSQDLEWLSTINNIFPYLFPLPGAEFLAFRPNLIMRLAGGIGRPLALLRMGLSLLGRLVMLLVYGTRGGVWWIISGVSVLSPGNIHKWDFYGFLCRVHLY